MSSCTKALWLVAVTTSVPATASSSSDSSPYVLEAPACATAFDARLDTTSCKADKISAAMDGAARLDTTSSSSSFPSEWTATMVQSLQAGYDSCSNCDDSNVLSCTMCNMYCQTLEVADSTAACALTSEATSGETTLDAVACSATFRSRIAWVTEKKDDYSSEVAYMGKPTQWFASVLSEFHEASQWCDQCIASGSDGGKGNSTGAASSSTECLQCSAACEMTHSLASTTDASSTRGNNAVIQDGAYWMGVHVSQEYTEVAKVAMWVAKKGAVVSAMVAAMVACVMAALTVTRSVRRWTRLKKLRRQFEESEGRKLVARPQGRHSYTEFTEF